MEMNVLTAIIGLLAGMVGSLIAPWIHWGIEKKKIRHQKRKDLIVKTREYLSLDNDKFAFQEHLVYLNLKPLLSDDLIKYIQSSTIEINIGERANLYIDKVNIELSKIEKKWKLI